MARALFNNAEQALNVTFLMTQRLSFLMAWALFWLAHLTLAVLIGLAMWMADLQAAEAAVAIRWLVSTTPLAVAAAAGVSILGLLGGYVKLSRTAVRLFCSNWLLTYLMQDARE